MATNAKGQWIGFGVGDADPDAPRDAPNWHAVTLINQKLYDRFERVRKQVSESFRTQSTYDATTAKMVDSTAKLYGMTVPVDLQGNAVANLSFRTKIGAYPPPPPPRHAALTVRGTGGLVDADPTSWIADASSNHYEVPIMYAATMGGIPVAVAGAGPSGNECADQVHQMLTDWVNKSQAKSGCVVIMQVADAQVPDDLLDRSAYLELTAD